MVLMVLVFVKSGGAAGKLFPNVIVFLVDDLGWQDTSVPFHSEITPLNRRYRTPHMEKLAATGMKFTQAYTSPVCTPTRVSLMTGLNAARHRVTNWTLRRNTSTDEPHPSLILPDWNVNGLSPKHGVERTVHAVALPALLRNSGYRTIHVGKAHFAANGTPGADPLNLGFDVNVAGHAAGAPGSYLGKASFSSGGADNIWNVPGLETYHGKDIFLSEALTIEANKAIDQAVKDSRPFFLYLAHYAVHTPFAVDERFYEAYQSMGLDKTEAMYAAMVEGVDKSLGDILANVERHGLSDRTVVLFLSDNGGLSAVARGGPAHTHNQPLSSGKGSAREGGLRVPMLIRWPGLTRPGAVCREAVIVEDLFPTILEIAGIKGFRQVGGGVDGVSLVPLLKQVSGYPAGRALFWHYPNHWGPTGPGIGPLSAIRHYDWKLIYYHADQHYELFHLGKDLGELNNLASTEPEVRKKLARRLRTYLIRVRAQMPMERATLNPVPWPD